MKKLRHCHPMYNRCYLLFIFNKLCIYVCYMLINTSYLLTYLLTYAFACYFSFLMKQLSLKRYLEGTDQIQASSQGI